MLLEKAKSDTTEVSNLMFNLNVTMQGVKTDLILIAALWNKFGCTVMVRVRRIVCMTSKYKCLFLY